MQKNFPKHMLKKNEREESQKKYKSRKKQDFVLNEPSEGKRTRGISSRFRRRGVLPRITFFFPPDEPIRLISRVLVIE